MYKTMTYKQRAVVQPSGDINSSNAHRLQQQLAETMAAIDYAHVQVDMTDVESLDSAGLMVLVSSLTLAQQLGKQLTLSGISPSVRIVFELTQLDRVFEIVEEQSVLEVSAA